MFKIFKKKKQKDTRVLTEMEVYSIDTIIKKLDSMYPEIIFSQDTSIETIMHYMGKRSIITTLKHERNKLIGDGYVIKQANIGR